MSHYTEVTCNYSNTETLVAALVASGVPREAIEVHEKAVPIYDFQGKTTRYRFNDTQDERFAKGDCAHVVIRRGFLGGASNDCGFYVDAEKGSIGFLCDFNRQCTKWNNDWLTQIGVTYAKEEVKAEYADKPQYEVEDEDHVYVFVKVGG